MTEPSSTITGTNRSSAGVESVPLFMALLAHYSGFYGCSGQEFWGDSEIVGWYKEGDHPPAGFAPEHAFGPVEAIPYLSGHCSYRGIRVLADALVDVDITGGFGGVAGGGPGVTQITVEVRQNAAIIHSETQYGPGGGWAYGWGGSFGFNFTDIAVAAGDELEVSVLFVNWVDYSYYATSPGEVNVHTHFRVAGVTVPSGRKFLRASATFAQVPG